MVKSDCKLGLPPRAGGSPETGSEYYRLGDRFSRSPTPLPQAVYFLGGFLLASPQPDSAPGIVSHPNPHGTPEFSVIRPPSNLDKGHSSVTRTVVCSAAVVNLDGLLILPAKVGTGSRASF